VCALCGLPIDPDLEAPDPGSFTVDHIIPLSTIRDPAERRRLRDDPANCRPAHRLCNMKRGTGRGRAATQGDRSAGW
jgi:5-methylcytosine-specific restriction endonuclease McrA